MARWISVEAVASCVRPFRWSWPIRGSKRLGDSSISRLTSSGICWTSSRASSGEATPMSPRRPSGSRAQLQILMPLPVSGGEEHSVVDRVGKRPFHHHVVGGAVQLAPGSVEDVHTTVHVENSDPKV